jgi:signal peptidase I
MVLIGLVYLFQALGYSITYSPSDSMKPYNFFFKTKVVDPTSIKKGDIVVFPMPKKFLDYERYYYKSGLWYSLNSDLVKFDGCSAGEVINTVNRKDYCNGKLIATVPRYADLIPVKHDKIKTFAKYHNLKIPKGYFFALGPDKYSLDSRYFGLVKLSSVKDTAVGFSLHL